MKCKPRVGVDAAVNEKARGPGDQLRKPAPCAAWPLLRPSAERRIVLNKSLKYYYFFTQLLSALEPRSTPGRSKPGLGLCKPGLAGEGDWSVHLPATKTHEILFSSADERARVGCERTRSATFKVLKDVVTRSN